MENTTLRNELQDTARTPDMHSYGLNKDYKGSSLCTKKPFFYMVTQMMKDLRKTKHMKK